MNIIRILLGSAVLLGLASQPATAITIGRGDGLAVDFYLTSFPYDPNAGYSTTLYLSGFDVGDSAYFAFIGPNTGEYSNDLFGPLDQVFTSGGGLGPLDRADFAWWLVLGQVGTFEVVSGIFEQNDYQVEGRFAFGVVPIPAALPLLASGLGALGFIGWRRKRKAAA